MKKERIVWIDTLKIIICISVMVGHYYGAFFSMCNNRPNLSSISVKIFEYLPKPFIDGNFCVFVFCILSGGLLSKKSITGLKELIIEIIFRYFRLFIPILITNFFVYILNCLTHFPSHIYATIYENDWLNGFFYNISLQNVLKSSITFSASLNGPLWMILPLFEGNILILIYKYIVFKFKAISNKQYIVEVFICVILLILSFKIDELMYVLATFTGVVIFNRKALLNDGKDYKGYLCLFVVMIVVLNYIPFVDKITVINNVSLKNFIFAIVLVCSLLKFKNNKNIKQRLHTGSEISLWIYLTHWPIVGACSSKLLMMFSNFTVGFWITFFVTVAGVYMISYMLSMTINKVIVKYMTLIKEHILKTQNSVSTKN